MGKWKIGYTEAKTVSYAASMDAVVKESRTILSVALTGNGTLNISSDARPFIGAEIIVKATSDATARDLTFGTGFTAPTLTGVINKTKVQHFVYDGSAFVPVATAIQID
ncbi:hypothetical protein GCM10007424_23740 [Flavobacterium suaedae]|uniref:Htaa domain-containing protein n=1 Tax=Flavobacterium suaedae TaxID=1767027 RepID=A0ABQ1K3E4_9FLAO|nr:hypothetical protein [Flavobacterium suaedae]GGB82966.1 hypothetical protein GCM10007424_23740 [Flavobacterium suaedae]